MLLMLFTGSCNRTLQSSITNNAVHQEKDSVFTAVRLRTDTITIKGDTVSVLFPIAVDCPDNAVPVFKPVNTHTSSQRAEVKIVIDSAGRLAAVSRCKELYELVNIADSIIISQNYTIDSISSHQKDVVQVRHIPGAYKWAMGFTVCFFILLFLYIAYKIFKLTPYGKLMPF